MIFSDNFQLVSLGKVYLIYKVFISEKKSLICLTETQKLHWEAKPNVKDSPNELRLHEDGSFPWTPGDFEEVLVLKQHHVWIFWFRGRENSETTVRAGVLMAIL